MTISWKNVFIEISYHEIYDSNGTCELNLVRDQWVKTKGDKSIAFKKDQ